MIILPPDNQWTQFNLGDNYGDLMGSFNVDFTKVVGKTRVTRMINTQANLDGTPIGFKFYNGSGGTSGIYTVAGTKVYLSASSRPNATFAADSQGSSPTVHNSLYSDIEVFNGFIYTTSVGSGTAQLNKLNSTWSVNGTSLLSSSVTHMLCTYAPDSQRLYISNGTQKIYSMDASDSISTSSYTLDLSSYGVSVVVMKAASNKIWIGTIGTSGSAASGSSKGYIFEWDGVSTRPTQFYRLDAIGAISCVIKDDMPHFIDTNGHLITYSGGTFIEEARLPIENKLLINATNTANNRFIHPNGMAVINGKINILVNNQINDNGSTITEFCPSGIWEYDDIIVNPYRGGNKGSGLYHKYSLSYLPVGTNTITDYGQNRLSIAGGLSEMKLPDTSASATGNLIAGATVYTDGSTTNAEIFTNDTFDATSGTTGQFNTQGYGYLVTSKQYAIDENGLSSVQNTWQNVVALYKYLILSTSKIWIKYRVKDIPPTEISITWTSTTTFTTTTNILGLENYEVEITQGTGGGFCSHISQIDFNGTVYTATLDETYTGVTGTAKARLQNWKKISSTSSNTQETKNQAGMNDLSNWVQIKICMLFSQKDELEGLIISNQNTLPVH